MMTQELLDRNSGAKTSDWIQQAKGCVIFAYDLGSLVSESRGKIDNVVEVPKQAPEREKPQGRTPRPSPR